MVAAGFGAADRVLKTGDSMSGTLGLNGSPPLTVPSSTSGYVLTADGSGNITLAPAAGGGGGVTLTPTAVKTSGYTTAAAEYVVCDATSSSFTVTLPAAPADKSVIGVKMVTTASSHTVTVACGGADVLNKTGGSTSLALSLTAQGVILQYKSSGAIWYVTGDDLPLSQLDSRYLAQSGGTVSGALAVTGTATVGGFNLASGATNTYVLTSDGSGNGSWAVAPGAGGGMANPMTALGDTIYENATPVPAKLAGNTTTTRKFMRQTGNGTISAAPAWDTLVTGDLPSGVAMLSGAAFTGAVSTTGNLSASGTLGVTGNATASGTLAVAKASTSGVFGLTDAGTITVDASKGNTFRVTLGGNRTMGPPSNATDGQMILFEITQGLAGTYTLAWSSASGGYLFTTALPAPVITTTAGNVDIVGFKYAASPNKWRCLAISQAYSS